MKEKIEFATSAEPAMQSVQEDAPVGAAYFPESQLVQLDRPVVDAYFPDVHDVHTVLPELVVY